MTIVFVRELARWRLRAWLPSSVLLEDLSLRLVADRGIELMLVLHQMLLDG
jgi:hypothetical protein